MFKYLKKSYLPPMLGSSMEYYDIALYAYMAPILTQAFFPNILKTKQYFIYFLIEFLASIMQIFGAKFYGKIGDIYGRKKAIVSAMQGVFIITLLVMLIPTYKEAGLLATFLFIFCRLIQSFFVGGEYNGGAIYCLELEKDESKHGFISGLYCATTAFGILIASIIAMIINYLGVEYFRYAYAISMIFIFYIYKYKKNMEKIKLNTQNIISNNSLKDSKISNFIVIALCALFFGVLYGLPTKIFNSLLPLYVNIDTNFLMLVNVFCLCIYIVLLIYAGHISCEHKPKKVMFYTSLIAAIASMPLFLLVNSKIIYMIIFAKIIFIILTAFFIGPFHAFSLKLFHQGVRYRKISQAYSTGKSISTLLLACSFYLYEITQNLISVGLILTIIAIITSGAIFYVESKKNKFFTIFPIMFNH